MLTRLEASGFKNLVDFELDFGPYTCIAGPNGVGKSNIFDAIRFLSLLTEHTMNDAAQGIRDTPTGQNAGNLQDIFFATNNQRRERFQLAAEMIVNKEVSDDFGRQAKSTSSFLRYEVAFRYEEPSVAIGPFGGLVLEREELRPIVAKHARAHLRFPHHKANFRDHLVYNRRFGAPYIDTTKEGHQDVILVHQDGGSRGRGRPASAERATRTIVGTENTVATPTILAARNEMRSWQVLALEPSAMRQPDRYTQPPGIASNGAHIPATLQHIGCDASEANTDHALAAIASRLSDLVPVSAIHVRQDDVRQLLSLELEEHSGLRLSANSVSDGTLRFLALSVLAESSTQAGVFCMEEPENGIHPANLEAMNLLLHDIAVNPYEPVGHENPLRQVVVATHSPYFVQLQGEDDLVLAKNVMKRTDLGIIEPISCRACLHTWRSGPQDPGVAHIALKDYLLPPDGKRLAIQDELWKDNGGMVTLG